ncbi:hypothetical protein FHS31_000443 [Sphingomonas vulcanisoli]|uniref:Uncharacterized protein n=1 Tax=Sphingomonas vulcanisoli TaxID=1658060 RepID=A0ABX0TN47_9SPHN|nr:hypothetical protein [Sphingomonas vulcanisoli]
MEQFHTNQSSGSSSGMLLGVLASLAMWAVMAALRVYL